MQNIGLTIRPEAIDEFYEFDQNHTVKELSTYIEDILNNTNEFLLENHILFQFEWFTGGTYDFIGSTSNYEVIQDPSDEENFYLEAIEKDLNKIIDLINNKEILKVEAEIFSIEQLSNKDKSLNN